MEGGAWEEGGGREGGKEGQKVKCREEHGRREGGREGGKEEQKVKCREK